MMIRNNIVAELGVVLPQQKQKTIQCLFLEAVSTLVPTRQSHLSDPRNAVLSWHFALGTHTIFLTNESVESS